MNQVQHVGLSEPDIGEKITRYNERVHTNLTEIPVEQWVAKLDDGRIVWATPQGFAAAVMGIAMAGVCVGKERFSVPIYNVWIPDDPAPPWIIGGRGPAEEPPAPPPNEKLSTFGIL